MKAIQFDRLGGPEVMELREVPKPELKPGTVIVKNSVIALNYGDVFFIQGQYLVKPVFPDIPGMEGAGIIDAVAPDVKGLAPGMRVAYIGMGAYAEYTRMRASRVIPIPDGTPFEQAAAFPIAVLTAWHLIHSCHHTTPDQTVLVHSAAGGVGIAAVQIARAAGATVIGTVSSDDKVDLVRHFGASNIINYETHDFATEVMRITDGRGVDLILDAVGKPTFEKGLTCLAPVRPSHSLRQRGRRAGSNRRSPRAVSEIAEGQRLRCADGVRNEGHPSSRSRRGVSALARGKAHDSDRQEVPARRSRRRGALPAIAPFDGQAAVDSLEHRFFRIEAEQ